MQDRYVGDVGDFGKYALLRTLAAGACTEPRLRLGVVWYRYPDEGHNGDGRHVAYLRKPSFASLDPDLHAGLNRLVASGRRSIVEVERSGLLPRDTVYHGEQTVGLLGDGTAPARRAAYRSEWLARALAATVTADLVFLDPDNGIATPAMTGGGPKSGKYASLDDLKGFWRRGQSLVVYHHLNRTAPVAIQVAGLSGRIAEALGRPASIYPLVLRRGSCRVLWILGQTRHAAALQARTENFASKGWHVHCAIPSLTDLAATATKAQGVAVATEPSTLPSAAPARAHPFGRRRIMRADPAQGPRR